jgi:hypothetical protein
MSTYCLTIKVRSKNEALLNNLIVTVETFHDNISEIETLEMFTATTEVTDTLDVGNTTQPELLDKEMFLDRWMISEE